MVRKEMRGGRKVWFGRSGGLVLTLTRQLFSKELHHGECVFKHNSINFASIDEQ
jgi:hypothetical protein